MITPDPTKKVWIRNPVWHRICNARLPSVLCTGELQNLTRWWSKTVPSTRESKLPGVLCTGESRLLSTLWVKTPRCPMYWGVAKPDPRKIQNSPKHRGVETPRCPIHQGVFFWFFEHSSPCYCFVRFRGGICEIVSDVRVTIPGSRENCS